MVHYLGKFVNIGKSEIMLVKYMKLF